MNLSTLQIARRLRSIATVSASAGSNVCQLVEKSRLPGQFCVSGLLVVRETWSATLHRTEKKKKGHPGTFNSLVNQKRQHLQQVCPTITVDEPDAEQNGTCGTIMLCSAPDRPCCALSLSARLLARYMWFASCNLTLPRQSLCSSFYLNGYIIKM